MYFQVHFELFESNQPSRSYGTEQLGWQIWQSWTLLVKSQARITEFPGCYHNVSYIDWKCSFPALLHFWNLSDMLNRSGMMVMRNTQAQSCRRRQVGHERVKAICGLSMWENPPAGWSSSCSVRRNGTEFLRPNRLFPAGIVARWRSCFTCFTISLFLSFIIFLQEELENFPLSTIHLCQTVLNQTRYLSVLLLVCQDKEQHRPDIHFFHCDEVEVSQTGGFSTPLVRLLLPTCH